MEDQGFLDSVSELHLFCLHYIYLPRIQRAVREFRNQWNNHTLPIEQNMTPLQLWYRGVISHVGQNITAVDSVFYADKALGTEEGSDGNTAPMPEMELNNVEIHENSFSVNNTIISEIQETIDPLKDDGNHGTSLFLTLVNFIGTRQSN